MQCKSSCGTGFIGKETESDILQTLPLKEESSKSKVNRFALQSPIFYVIFKMYAVSNIQCHLLSFFILLKKK